jgi:SAM-dependent methyltransferase
MLGRARARSDIEWVLADAASAAWDREFDLAVMAGHAFQELTGDDELRRSLRAIRAALRKGGRFAFETRHPRARAWEGWNTSFEVRNPAGDVALVGYWLREVTGDLVRFTETLSGRWWDRPGGALGPVAPRRPPAAAPRRPGPAAGRLAARRRRAVLRPPPGRPVRRRRVAGT